MKATVQMRRVSGVTAANVEQHLEGKRATVALSRSGAGDRQADPMTVALTGVLGGGREIPHRAAMEESFGRDFSHVRAFVGGAAQTASATLGADAYAMGDAVAFRDTSPSKALVAHELTHVIQQMERGSTLSRGIDVSGEAEAEAVERAVAAGRPASSSLRGGGNARKPATVRGGAPALKKKKEGKAGSATTITPEKIDLELSGNIPLSELEWQYPPKGAPLFIYANPSDLAFTSGIAGDIKNKSVTVKAGVNLGADIGVAGGILGAEAFLECQPRVEGSASLTIGEKGTSVDASVVFKGDVYAGVRVDCLDYKSEYRFLLASGTFATIKFDNLLKDDPDLSLVQFSFGDGLKKMWAEFWALADRIADAPEAVREAMTQWMDVKKPGAFAEKLDETLAAHHAAQSKQSKILSSHKRYYEGQFESFRVAKNLAVLATLRDTQTEFWEIGGRMQGAKLDALLAQYLAEQEKSRAMAKSEVAQLIEKGVPNRKAEELGRRYIDAIMQPGDRYTLESPYKHDNANSVNETINRYHAARSKALAEAKDKSGANPTEAEGEATQAESETAGDTSDASDSGTTDAPEAGAETPGATSADKSNSGGTPDAPAPDTTAPGDETDAKTDAPQQEAAEGDANADAA